MKGSIYKKCPFKKGYCNKDCALYNDESVSGCVFLHIDHSINQNYDLIFHELSGGIDHVIRLLEENSEEQD